MEVNVSQNQMASLFALLVLTAFPGKAVVYEYQTIEKQIQESGYIVFAEVIGKETGEYLHKFKGYTKENGEKVEFDVNRKSISTFYELRVIEPLSGDVTDSKINVMVAGGCFNGACESFSHSYDLEINEKAVLFLTKGENGIFYAKNSSFDVFSVSENNLLNRKTGSVIYPAEKNKSDIDDLIDINLLKRKIKALKN
jgi:hypothetical protein